MPEEMSSGSDWTGIQDTDWETPVGNTEAPSQLCTSTRHNGAFLEMGSLSTFVTSWQNHLLLCLPERPLPSHCLPHPKHELKQGGKTSHSIEKEGQHYGGRREKCLMLASRLFTAARGHSCLGTPGSLLPPYRSSARGAQKSPPGSTKSSSPGQVPPTHLPDTKDIQRPRGLFLLHL